MTSKLPLFSARITDHCSAWLSMQKAIAVSLVVFGELSSAASEKPSLLGP